MILSHTQVFTEQLEGIYLVLEIMEYFLTKLKNSFQFDQTKCTNRNCDWILENGSKSHIFISVYLSLQHENYCIPNNISLHYKEYS